MGKYDALIADAKVTLTDIRMNALNAENSGCGLKIQEYAGILQNGISLLENKKSASMFSKFKDAIFETSDDKQTDRTARQLSDAVYQLKYCIRCKCSNCVSADAQCRCGGCLYGSFVNECDRQTETRQVENGVITVDDHPALRMKYNRGSGETIVTVINENGTRMDCRLDLKTGKSSPL